jgi:glycerol kinase
MTQTTLLAIDQGTTSSRAIVFSRSGQALCSHQKDLALSYPANGWVEQDPADIWMDTLWAVRQCVSEYPDISAIGITNQRETTIVWDRASGKPVYNAIVWQDRRMADLCRQLKDAGHEAMISEKTGLLLDPYFSATKLSWILNHVEGARAKAMRGELLFGTVDTWLLWNMTGGAVHATDATNASRTMLFNIRTQEWDTDLLDLFRIPAAMLPEVKDNASDFGTTAVGLLPRTYKIGGMAGDQHAALIGQACFRPGMVKSTYGTGCFALMNIGSAFRASENRLLTTIAYRFQGQAVYAIEGSIFVAGAAIQWLRDNAGFFERSQDSEALARSVPDTNGVYFVPAFTGLGAPYWDPLARGAILGLTRETTRAHITRAALEAQAYQTLDLMEAMVKDGGTDPAVIRADGGLAANKFMCQFLADMLDKPIEIPACLETTALGAAYLAGLQAGIYKDLDDIASTWSRSNLYEPASDDASRQTLYAGWKKAVDRITDNI